ncbi:MAG: large-conductance mechanosensitive channel protein MscL [Ruminococcaceae bacterium]|nr:large-conductance mechanosensitive channel protein MscL [Oscillospiraceae bacterium]
MAKEKKGGFLKEFKEFAVKGNMFDMAVGVIIGGAFKTLVDSLTANVIMPIISVFTGGVNFSAWKITLGTKVVEGETVANELLFGDFVSAIINFVIMAFVVFLMVKAMNRLREMGKKQEEEAPAAPPEPSNEEKLLTEIRDLLKK